MELDVSDADAALRWRGPGTDAVLALYRDDVWFWLSAWPAPPWSDQAGSFRCETSPAERAALRDLGHREISVLDDAAAAVAPLLAPDRMRAISVVEMRATVATPPGAVPMLAASFASTGTEGVTMRLNAGSIRLLDADGPWRELAPPRMGLVDGGGNLLDGLYRDAVIAPGGLGAWLLGSAPAGPAVNRSVRIAGTIETSGPIPPQPVPFEVTAPVRPADADGRDAHEGKAL